MPKNILVYSGSLAASTSTTTIYTCPTLTVAEVRVDLTYKRSNSATYDVLINGGDTTPDTSNYNLRIPVANSDDVLHNGIFYKNDGHVLGRTVQWSTSSGDSENSSGDVARIYDDTLMREGAFSSSSTRYPYQIGPKFYMRPGDKIKIRAESSGSDRIFYNFVVIEEASTLT